MPDIRGRVGSKGELYPPKRIRQAAGLAPGDEVSFRAKQGVIEVIKVPTVWEAMAKPAFAKVSFDQFEAMTDEVLVGVSNP